MSLFKRKRYNTLWESFWWIFISNWFKKKALNTFNFTWTLSSSPKTMAEVPVVKIPPLNNTFGPILFRYWPYSGETKNTTNSNTPNTRPYSVAVHPFFSAYQMKENKLKTLNINHNFEKLIDFFKCLLTLNINYFHKFNQEKLFWYTNHVSVKFDNLFKKYIWCRKSNQFKIHCRRFVTPKKQNWTLAPFNQNIR